MINKDSIRIFPLGEYALTIEFGNEISETLNGEVLNLARQIDSNRFPGFIEAVPAYSSLTIFYDILAVRKSYPQFSTAFEAVKKNVLDRELEHAVFTYTPSRILEVPVNFNPENAPDLPTVAGTAHLESAEVIRIFTSKVYRVYMLGFLPGFAYMGQVDPRIATPRRAVPRLKVPKGSVGIAGSQTGIYPLESPGGWQIIGRTELALFTPHAASPALFAPGDSVKFSNIND